MLDNVTGNVGAHIVVGVSASLLCVLLIMGLKLKWFRARMTFDQIPAQEETPYVGVYRNKFASEFDGPSRNSFTSTPLAPPPPPPALPASVPMPIQLPQSSRKPNGVQASSNDEKPKKKREDKQKVLKANEVNTKPPKAAKVKAPKLPREVKPEVQHATGVIPKEAKTKQSKVKAPKIPKETSTNTISKPTKVKVPKSSKEISTNISKPSKVKAPKSPKEVSTNISKPPKEKESKGAKTKTKVKDNTERQLSNGAVTHVEQEVVSTTNNTFLFSRPKSAPIPRPQQQEEQEEEEDGSAMLHYNEEESFGRGQNRAMKTFTSMMPTKGQVDLSVSPIPQRTPGAYRNPIAAGVASYQSPRGAGSKPTSGSVYIDMNAQYGRANQQFIMNLEDESET